MTFSIVGKIRRFARSANGHLIDDETVAKMGHPVVVVRSDVGHPSKTDLH
jgi:hypothetical protein